uniref:Uncharacterized protein n=1 Tax=Timema bartmani TaxID=61472 RepID=A0A7R9I5I5_9NEOP|nr:unnamed protein product [Timema bartmani]
MNLCTIVLTLCRLGYRLPAMPWSWLPGATAAPLATPTTSTAAPLMLTPRTARRRYCDASLRALRRPFASCSQTLDDVHNRTWSFQNISKLQDIISNNAVSCPATAAALRGVAIQRGRARAAYPAAAAAAFARHPTPLTAAAATALQGYAPVYYDPFLAAHAAQADPNYRLQIVTTGGMGMQEKGSRKTRRLNKVCERVRVCLCVYVRVGRALQAAACPVVVVFQAAAAAAAAATPLLKTPLSTAQQASYAAAASYTAVAARAYGAAAAAAQPVAGYAAVAGYGREYADPYLGHSIGPVAGYGIHMRRYTEVGTTDLRPIKVCRGGARRPKKLIKT